MSQYSNTSLTRINKYICETGLCSRKAADDLVIRGEVLINGTLAELGNKVASGDTVTVSGVTVKPLDESEVIFIALNKPVGIVCTAARTDQRNVIDFVGHNCRIFPVGRLDKNSQGLLFLTNRCDLVDRILRGGDTCEKEYVVTVDREITDEFVTGLSQGVPILGTVTKPCEVKKISSHMFSITLVQGLNRQIRRMCKHYGYSVEKLERVRVMHIELDGLAQGQWRDLTASEMATMHELLA